MTADKKIKAAMRAHERDVMAHIRREGVYTPFLPGRVWRNAIDRLEDAGKLRWEKKLGGYVAVKKRKETA